ncbi:uncharacterized protein LOC143220079 [Lasioglossum baleicum]|uniref:uncharacterized protein LOC143220079 n=1 Tax=Lasioglossum baleicum TaxID=434251 RepID=UPI003FCE0AFF
MTDDSSDSINDLINYIVAIDRMSSHTRKAWEQTLTDTRMPNSDDMFKYLRNASHQGNSHTTVTSASVTKSAVVANHGTSAKRQSRIPKRSWEFATTSKGYASSPPPKKTDIHGRTNGLLTTAQLYVLDRDQTPVLCRTLIDTCSNANLMTTELARRLHLPTTRQTAIIEALNEMNTTTSNLVTTTIKARLTNYKRILTFCTIPRIAGPLPDSQVNRSALHIPANIRLADPEFHRPGAIDMLLGTGPALSCLSIGQINLSTRRDTDLILQKTQFGWIIGGGISTTSRSIHKTLATNVQFYLQRFWEVEEGPVKQFRSADDQACEDHFATTVRRDDSGRYIVALPFNDKRDHLEESRSRALNRLLSLERKLERDPELKQQYVKILEEYLALGHMKQVEAGHAPGFYLPHHAVVKPSSSTTKVRVVFDGSAKSSTNISLNETLRVGPTLQEDLFSLLLRFRMHAYVLTADIEKMYRQFLVRAEDRAYQRILWRDSHGEISTFELNTVTFGLASAPYLAIRCLHQLADDEQRDFPKAATRLKSDLYVDDLLTGAESIEESKLLQHQIISY